MIALISCVSKKKNYPCEAKELYISPLFRKSYSYAEKRCSDIFILSAKYQLVHSSEVIAPYEMTLVGMPQKYRKIWGRQTSIKIKSKISQGSNILILAGANYLEYLDLSGYIVINPLKGMGIGKRLEYLTNH